MELKPCAECHKRVSDLEIKRGEGVSVGGRFYCGKCAEDLDIEMKSDYSAMKSSSDNAQLSDTQFFKRAGKLYKEISRKERMRRGRRAQKTRPRRREPIRSRTRSVDMKKQGASPTAYIIAGIVGVVIVIIILIVLIARS
jgi:hypothetical protein